MNQNMEKDIDSLNKTSWVKKTALVFIALFLLLTASTAAFYWYASGVFDKPRSSKPTFAIQDVKPGNDDDYGNYPNKVNILVLGVDNRTEDVGRSDTMFVVMLDTKTKQVSLLSVPRDTRVQIPGLGWDKINHAYAYGGVKLSKRAAEGLLGISLNYYACVNFKAFYNIIDSLGGVDINVEERMYYEDPYDDLIINLHPGFQKLDGRSAMHYVRYRDWEGDIGRIARQQKFVKAVIQQAASPLTLTKLPSIISNAAVGIETDMTVSEIVGLAKFLKDAAQNTLKAEMVQGTPTLIDGVDYWIPDIMNLRSYVAKTQGIENDQKWLVAAREKAEQYYNSIPSYAEFDEIPFWLKDNGYMQSVATLDKKSTNDTKKKNDVVKEQDNDDDNDNDSKSKNKSLIVKEKDLDEKAKSKDIIASKPDSLKNEVKDSKPKQPDKPKQSTVTTPVPLQENIATKAVEAKNSDKKASASTTLQVNIVNASGSPEASGKMANEMRSHGFAVIGVTTAANPNPNTLVIANTYNDNVTEKLNTLPFRHALRVNDEPNKASLVTVIIGKDYLRQ